MMCIPAFSRSIAYTCVRNDHQECRLDVKLTWLVLGEDPAARSHRVEQFTAL
jgi:hypothetical protein